jgi:hypothetical protein
MMPLSLFVALAVALFGISFITEKRYTKSIKNGKD